AHHPNYRIHLWSRWTKTQCCPPIIFFGAMTAFNKLAEFLETGGLSWESAQRLRSRVREPKTLGLCLSLRQSPTSPSPLRSDGPCGRRPGSDAVCSELRLGEVGQTVCRCRPTRLPRPR